ncbi:MAG: patatin family protein [Spirochaetes bacterium]|nr:patatin family protein [Spirochaetota bacterium]
MKLHESVYIHNADVTPRGKRALIVEGGGMRGVFSAGVLFAMGLGGVTQFDLYIGVSAGACNLASFLGRQYERNFYIMEKWSASKRFINPLRLLYGNVMDLDWLWDTTISNYRLNLKEIFKDTTKEFLIVVTSMNTGKALYIKPCEDNLEFVLKASSALPILYRNTLYIDGHRVADGGVGDSIPVLEAYKRGARDIVVIRSQGKGYRKNNIKFKPILKILFLRYPEFTHALMQRHTMYNAAIEFIEKPPGDVRIIEVCPPATFKTKRTTTHTQKLLKDYYTGIQAGYALCRYYKQFL